MHLTLSQQLQKLDIDPESAPAEYQQLFDLISETYNQFEQDNQLKAKNIQKSEDEFFSIASHELRTPLTAIRGNASIILHFYRDKLPDTQIVDMLIDINQSGVRLIKVVNDFFNVFQLEQGKMRFKKERFDILEVVSQVLDELRPIDERHPVKLVMEHSSPLPIIVSADPTKTKDVLINLVSNALKFTSQGQVTVSVASDDQGVKVLVSDSGTGIAPELKKSLFLKFRHDAENVFTRDTTKGTGLGLYISRLMVEGMGGKIWLEKSQLQEGSVFALALPMTS